MNTLYSVVARASEKNPTSEVLFEGTAEQVYIWLLTTRQDLLGLDVKDEESSTYYFVGDFKKLVGGTRFVTKYHEMNPETEDILPDGGFLAEGMVVLIEDANHRGRASEIRHDWQIDHYKTANRWCTVSQLRVSISEDFVRFVGIYEDNTKRSREYPVGKAWLVRKDSIGDSIAESSHRYANADTIVRSAFGKLVDRCADGVYGLGSGKFTYDDILEETKEKLLDTL